MGCLRIHDKGVLKNDNLEFLIVVDKEKNFSTALAFGWQGVSLSNGSLP
jgi:hypothetical protein